MKITRDKSIEEWAYNEVRGVFSKEIREGIHLSDLVMLRKAYWQRIKPLPPTDEEIDYWVSGRAIEYRFLNAIGYQKAEAKEWEGIMYTPDLFFSFPAEFKTRRGWIAKEGEEEERYDLYLKQLKGYCAIERKTQGWLLVFSLVEKQADHSTKPERAFYRVEFTEEELKQCREELLYLRQSLLYALDTHEFKHLPLCPGWACGKEIKTMTRKPYCETCGREFEGSWGAIKHLDSRTGAGHTMRTAEYEREFKERCKWYQNCQGDK